MSEVQHIPLGRIMPPRRGSVDPAAFPDEEFELYSIPAFDQGTPEIVPGSRIGSAKQIVHSGDVLLSRIVPHIRRAWVVGKQNGRRLIASGEWIVFHDDDADPGYLRHVLVGDRFHAEFMRTVSGVGGSLLRARPTNVAKIEIPLPPLTEQRRIAAILDAADALRAKRRAAIAKLDELIQSIFLDMFGDPQVNPKRFPVKVLPEFYVNSADGTKCGPFGSALKKHEFVQGGVPVWNMDNIDDRGRMVLPCRMWITPHKFRQLASYAVRDGDVIISRAGTVGKMCVVSAGFSESIISTNLIRVRFGTGLLPLYFVSLMTYCKGRLGRLKTGPDGAFTHMSTRILDTLKFPYPPPALQKRFVETAQSIEAQTCAFGSQAAELEKLFASLQHHAFRGGL